MQIYIIYLILHPKGYSFLSYHGKVSEREKIYHIFQYRRNLQITSTIKAGRCAPESDIYQSICQSIYQPICCLICYAGLITLLPQHHCPATTISLPRYHNIIALLRQHHCPATAILLFCYGSIILLLFKALSRLFSVLVVKLIEPIKVKKRASIVRLCEIFGCLCGGLCEILGVYSADYVKIELF